MRYISLNIKNIYLLLLIIAPVDSLAQGEMYARKVIRTLCNASMHGRGYVQKGDSLAAAWISDEFRKIGLKAFNNNYYQEFTLSVNSFPDTLWFEADGRTLIPGVEYLIGPGSPSLKGEYQVEYFDQDLLLEPSRIITFVKKARNKFVVFEHTSDVITEDSLHKVMQDLVEWLRKDTIIQIAGIIEVSQGKLTWSVRNYQDARPCLIVREDVFKKRISTINIHVKNRFHKAYRTRNVMGYILGKNPADSILVVSAHYDHLGRMGSEIYFPGANDNASGVAMMLDLAHRLVKEPKCNYLIVFIAFAGEEVGLEGSRFFINNPPFSLDKIKFLINLDLVGTGDEGITVVNGTIYNNEFNRLMLINSAYHFMPAIKARGEACNSDHCYFFKNGVPCFFIYTMGGIQAYHDIHDHVETLPLTGYDGLCQLLIRFIRQF